MDKYVTNFINFTNNRAKSLAKSSSTNLVPLNKARSTRDLEPLLQRTNQSTKDAEEREHNAQLLDNISDTLFDEYSYDEMYRELLQNDDFLSEFSVVGSSEVNADKGPFGQMESSIKKKSIYKHKSLGGDQFKKLRYKVKYSTEPKARRKTYHKSFIPRKLIPKDAPRDLLQTDAELHRLIQRQKSYQRKESEKSNHFLRFYVTSKKIDNLEKHLEKERKKQAELQYELEKKHNAEVQRKQMLL